jgi:hypothetical protein
MQEAHDQGQARRFYESIEYHVDSIDVANAVGKRADSLVIGFGDTILAEVKSTRPGAEYEAALELVPLQTQRKAKSHQSGPRVFNYRQVSFINDIS